MGEMMREFWRFFWSWIHYLAVRTDPATQLEHRHVATAIEAELCPHVPAIFEALDEGSTP